MSVYAKSFEVLQGICQTLSQTEISCMTEWKSSGQKKKKGSASVYHDILFINWLECPKATNKGPLSPKV